jgi:hypothetical protein
MINMSISHPGIKERKKLGRTGRENRSAIAEGMRMKILGQQIYKEEET